MAMDLNQKNEAARERALRLLLRGFDGVAEQLESPIEVALYWALLEECMERGACQAHDLREFGIPSWFRIRGDFEWIVVHPQKQIETPSGTYRVDFLAESHTTAPTPDGQNQRLTEKVVVECDGHDFHERTKEQASRDRARDRQLQLLGYTVLRYTGSDIYRDPVTIAREVVQAIDSRLQARFGEACDLYHAIRNAPAPKE